MDDAQTQVDVATKTLEAATARRDLLEKVVGELEAGTDSPLPIEAPADGVLRTVSALPGPDGPGRAPRCSRWWTSTGCGCGCRCTSATCAEIDADAARSAARPPAGGPGATRGRTVAAPPAANPLAGTVDLFFSTLNPDADDDRWRAAAASVGFAVAPFDRTPLQPRPAGRGLARR